jgi:hypothetical protein
MRRSSCQVEFGLDKTDTVRWGKATVADRADCGVSICSDCRTECCGESFCDHCYDRHLTYSCLRKDPRSSEHRRRADREAA